MSNRPDPRTNRSANISNPAANPADKEEKKYKIKQDVERAPGAAGPKRAGWRQPRGKAQMPKKAFDEVTSVSDLHPGFGGAQQLFSDRFQHPSRPSKTPTPAKQISSEPESAKGKETVNPSAELFEPTSKTSDSSLGKGKEIRTWLEGVEDFED